MLSASEAASSAKRGTSLLLLVLLLLQPAALLAVTAPPDEPPAVDEATRELLEKSLSVVELDKEIARIADRRRSAEKGIRTKELQIAVKDAQIERRRGDAGRVLRSYYTGERDALLTAFLSARSLNDLAALYDYFDAVFIQDQITLNAYGKQYRSLRKEHGALVEERGRLALLEQELRRQRERVAALQAEVDGELAASGDAERLRRLIEEMNRYWETVGLMQVNRYFRALADAMVHLPDFVKENKGMLEADGLTYTLTLPEEALNRFLRERDPMFDVFDFRFDGGSVAAHGKEGAMEIEVIGHYTVQSEPVNALVFHVDELVFNGLKLPDTTRRELERKFDLGFYPQKIVPFVRAEDVSAKDGILKVRLGVGLQSKQGSP